MTSQKKRTKNGVSVLNWSQRIARLTPQKQELIHPVVENPGDFLFLSIRALAQKLDTDTATTLRIVRRMGFSGYPEFRRYLHEVTIANVTSFQSMISSPSKDSDVPAHVHDALVQDQKNLAELHNSLSADRLHDLAKRIWDARRIVLVAGDLASSLVFYLEYHLTMLGLPVFGATIPGRTVAMLRTANKKDVVIAISFHRGLRQTVEGLMQARSKGAFCVGITDTLVSPLVRHSDECLFASVITPHFGDSYVAPMALMNVLLAACANYRRDRTLRLMRDASLDEQRGYRWFEETDS
ncbi:MAG: MurR/RpiR family transcriptional regulator [Acidobacteria bacterium]|nr:MurR/RpiR family transcriptional regulator [Acidobacteriota bacterium]